MTHKFLTHFFLLFYLNINKGYLNTTLPEMVGELCSEIPEYSGLNDILLNGLVPNDCLEKAYKLKIIQMRVGVLWENLFVLKAGFLKFYDGLDLYHVERKIAIELKNAWNTDNANSKETCFKKLAEFKQLFPDHEVIYANINGRLGQGVDKTEIYDGVEIRTLTGNDLLEYIFGEDYQSIIDEVRQEIIDQHCFN